MVNNIRCDNEPEFISDKFQDWCKANDIAITYSQPGGLPKIVSLSDLMGIIGVELS